MNKDLVEKLICPECRSDQLTLEIKEEELEQVLSGTITCIACSREYTIAQGILNILPDSLNEQKQSQAEFFAECVDDYEERVVNSTFYRALYEVTFMEWVNKNLNKDCHVLDMGCGTAKQSLLLAEQGIRSVGLDVSREMLEVAQKKSTDSGYNALLDFVVADGEAPPFKDGAFDAGVLGGFLHHVPRPELTIKNVAQKLKAKGLLYSSDPHKSPVRFIFDFMMKIWKLYDEEANDDPLIARDRVTQWFSDAGLSCSTRISTYLPPHLMYMMSVKTNTRLLKASDRFFNAIPLLRDFGGVIIAEGVKTVEPEKSYA